MPNTTSTDENSGNEITRLGKIVAGLLIILLTAFSAIYLIGHWPDELPDPKKDIKPIYNYEWFHVELAEISKSGPIVNNANDIASDNDSIVSDSILVETTIVSEDTATATNKPEETIKKNEEKCLCKSGEVKNSKNLPLQMHLNTILLILVACAGFLGNMIHVSTSFTTFIGAEKFKRSWTLWYCVKPFTAAALAICLYFVFRAGFLNMSNDSTNINIYGLVTLSFLTGLFTDKATVKLKEIFEVMMRPKEERPDPLEGSTNKVITVKTELSEDAKTIKVVITGKNLPEKKIAITIEGQPVTNAEITAEKISFTYTIPDTVKDKEEIILYLKPEKDGTAQEYKIRIKPVTTTLNNGENSNDTDTVSSVTDPGDIVNGEPDVNDDNEPTVNA